MYICIAFFSILLPNEVVEEMNIAAEEIDPIDAEIMPLSDESVDDSIADPNFVPSDTEMCDDQQTAQQSDTYVEDISTEEDKQATTEESPKTAPIKRRKKQNPKYQKLTHEQKSDRNKRQHPMRPPCFGKCRNSCQEFTEEERQVIWLKYWNSDYTSRRKWLSKNVHLTNIKRRTVVLEAPNKARKKHGRLYFLPKQGKSLRVCRLFLLNTLGYTNDSVITELCLAMTTNPVCSTVKENRGGSSKKCDRELIKRHIESYNPCVSHYRRNNAPNIRYLPRDLTLKMMYEDFNEKHANVCKLEVYRQTLKSEHISFCMPKSDKCVDCEMLERGQEDARNSENNDDLVKLSDELRLHKEKAAKANAKYLEDSLSDFKETLRVYSMDLQKVILIPNMPSTKDSYFVSRLVAFNETFAALQKNGPKTSYCVVWHEAIGGRNGYNIVNAILKLFEQERDVQDFILWADNCSAQNKNWILFTALVATVNKENGPKNITIRYLTKGHTHMTADGVHGNIEKRISRLKNIYDYDDLKNAIRTSRKNIEVVDLDAFRKWDKKKRQPRKNNDSLKDLVLNSLVEVNFQRGSREMRYKTDFGDEYKKLDFLQKKINIENYMPDLVDIRGIKKEKKEKIIQVLVPLMPANRRLFWEGLPVNDEARDLIQNIDIEEDL